MHLFTHEEIFHSFNFHTIPVLHLQIKEFSEATQNAYQKHLSRLRISSRFIKAHQCKC